MKNELIPQTSSEEVDKVLDKKYRLLRGSNKTYAEDETEMIPLTVQKNKYEDAKPITEKEYLAYRKKLAKETLRKLKYPNGKPENKILGYKMDLFSKLGNRAGNLNIDLSSLAPKKEESSSSDSEIENEMLKCRDKVMSDIYQKIDVYKIETMKKISKGQFEEIEQRPDDKAKKAKAAEKYWQKNKNSIDMKISKLHTTFLKIESMATKNNILMFIIGACLFTVFVLPFLMYSWSVIDKHYLGWFHEPLPPFAKTTDEKMYYSDQGIPFITIQDIYAERDHHNKLLAKGHPSYYQQYKDELYESVLHAIGYYQTARRLQEVGVEDPIVRTNDVVDDEEITTADTGPKYEALYPEPILTLE